jgi:hypothetical protein
MITTQEKINLLSTPSWSYREIMLYFNVSKTTAIKIKNRAIKEKKGGVQFGSHLAKTDSILSLYGTTRENEIQIVKNAQYEKEEL